MQSPRDGRRATERAYKRWEKTVKYFLLDPDTRGIVHNFMDRIIPMVKGSDLELLKVYVARAQRAGIPTRKVSTK